MPPKVTCEAALEEFSLHGFEVNDRQLVWSPTAEESVHWTKCVMSTKFSR